VTSVSAEKYAAGIVPHVPVLSLLAGQATAGAVVPGRFGASDAGAPTGGGGGGVAKLQTVYSSVGVGVGGDDVGEGSACTRSACCVHAEIVCVCFAQRKTWRTLVAPSMAHLVYVV
jgi:hypothetical protein